MDLWTIAGIIFVGYLLYTFFSSSNQGVPETRDPFFTEQALQEALAVIGSADISVRSGGQDEKRYERLYAVDRARDIIRHKPTTAGLAFTICVGLVRNYAESNQLDDFRLKKIVTDFRAELAALSRTSAEEINRIYQALPEKLGVLMETTAYEQGFQLSVVVANDLEKAKLIIEGVDLFEQLGSSV